MKKIQERPTLFKGAMVRAILSGNKTMTRRVVKLPGNCIEMVDTGNGIFEMLEQVSMGRSNRGHIGFIECPQGKVGDFLYVKENYRFNSLFDALKPSLVPAGSHVDFLADDFKREWPYLTGKTRPSIFMPRWASRLDLKIANVRIERLQAISIADAKKEGIPEYYPDALNIFQEKFPRERSMHVWDNHTTVENFKWLWDSINGKPRKGGVDISWASNPFVFVIEFEKVQG